MTVGEQTALYNRATVAYNSGTLGEFNKEDLVIMLKGCAALLNSGQGGNMTRSVMEAVQREIASKDAEALDAKRHAEAIGLEEKTYAMARRSFGATIVIGVAAIVASVAFWWFPRSSSDSNTKPKTQEVPTVAPFAPSNSPSISYTQSVSLQATSSISTNTPSQTVTNK